MGDQSGIQWTDATWNPVRGCSLVSPGCSNCYAMKTARRFDHPGGPYEGLTQPSNAGPVWSGKIRLVPELLDQPLRWRKPRRIFVNSMSDLFHQDVPDQFIDTVWAVMNLAPHHTFQLLTKRPERMRSYLNQTVRKGRILPDRMGAIIKAGDAIPERILPHSERRGRYQLAPPNVWLGISAEDQTRLDERVPHLLQTPAAVRFVSAEPLLGPVDVRHWIGFSVGSCSRKWSKETKEAVAAIAQAVKREHGGGLDWIIVGGESGPRARPCNVEWIRSIVRQCREAGVACFVKQLGARPTCEPFQPGRTHACQWNLKDSHGGDPSEWPEDLRVREFPS